MNSACLFIKASSDACANEIEAIEANLKAVDSSTVMEVFEWVDRDTEKFKAHVENKKFRLIYLGAHADGHGFGDNNSLAVSWELLANAICWTDCIIPGGILFMGCCRGGMKTVALKILKECNKIDYIVGTSQGTRGGDLVTAFTAFVRALRKGDPPGDAVKKASGGTGSDYICHDRQELEIEVSLSRQLDSIESLLQTLYLRQEEVLNKMGLPSNAISKIGYNFFENRENR